MIGEAYALGSGTIINAIATGKGAAFGLDLKVKATVKLDDSGIITGRIREAPAEKTTLIERCVRKVLDRFGLEYGAEVETESNVPLAKGLSSSSAAANATVLATLSALGKGLDDLEAINLGIDAAVESNVTITGAFDDASASYFGGCIITDNVKRDILKKFDMDRDLTVLIYCPEEKAHTTETNVRRMKLFHEQVQIAFNEALAGDVYRAMTLNGLIYCASLGFPPTPAILALEGGAIASGLSGTGSAVIALCKRESKGDIMESWDELGGEVIVTRPNNDGARVIR
ncbi:MAG: shikimate kinase [Candidatus Hydrothermarchaeales archaeon]